ncbi:DUF4212 domain-containing protein [Comamonas sp. Y33R10-2]|uniref:DUF4212 domain-containing protein n=1 Tax=Comamonas sp. Y33R10-2 TaxID=2853257 RepID=UPI001C5CBD2D|nr:DUF4212 domain-containing protein [Comamonas sp. Y33R10-2]QXZ09703.1 DUF4212 domain-containing protein [Comamonas sp. Y33R10-2]
MQTQQAPQHDDVVSNVSLQAFDAFDPLGKPVEVTSPEVIFPPDLLETHHLRLKALLLTVWVVFSFGTSYFARDIQALMPGWPAAYWMVAQGAILMFLLIIVVYCVAMDYFERQQARDKVHQATLVGDATSSATDFHA